MHSRVLTAITNRAAAPVIIVAAFISAGIISDTPSTTIERAPLSGRTVAIDPDRDAFESPLQRPTLRFAMSGLIGIALMAGGALFFGRQLGQRLAATERRTAEALRLSHQEAEDRARRAEHWEREMKAVLDAVPAAIWVARGAICGSACGRDCGQVTGNKAGYEMLGLIQGSNMLSPIPQAGHYRCGIFLDGKPAVPGEIPIQRAANGEELWGIDLELRSGDGRGRYLHGNAVPLHDAEGAVVGAVAAFIDRTERHKADALIAESEERYRALFHMAPLSVTLIDAETGEIVDFNRKACEDRGYGPEEFSRLQLWDISFSVSKATFPAFVDEIVTGLRTTQRETKGRRKDGSAIDYLTVCHPIRLKGRNYIYGMQVDITDLKNTQRALSAAKLEAERANDAKSRFLAAASHDLRQPLQALNLYMGVLAGKRDPANAAVLTRIDHCLSSLNGLLADMLDLSKLDAGVVSPKASRFAVAALFDKVIATYLPEAAQKGLRLRHVQSGLIGHTDPILFERMLANLVSNAIRYTQSGNVLIGCRRRRGRVWVEVWDTGIGIPSDQTCEIFEEFRQLGNAERSREKGSGLGLAIVRKTARLLGLEIRVSSSLGKGSMFAVELPLEGLRPDDDRRIGKAAIHAKQDHQLIADATPAGCGGWEAA